MTDKNCIENYPNKKFQICDSIRIASWGWRSTIDSPPADTGPFYNDSHDHLYNPAIITDIKTVQLPGPADLVSEYYQDWIKIDFTTTSPIAKSGFIYANPDSGRQDLRVKLVRHSKSNRERDHEEAYG